MITLFPALLVLCDRRRAWPPRGGRRPRGHRLERIRRCEWLARHRVPVLSVAAVLTAVALVAVPARRLRLQPAQPPGQGHRVGRRGSDASSSGPGAPASPRSPPPRTLDELRAKQAAFAEAAVGLARRRACSRWYRTQPGGEARHPAPRLAPLVAAASASALGPVAARSGVCAARWTRHQAAPRRGGVGRRGPSPAAAIRLAALTRTAAAPALRAARARRGVGRCAARSSYLQARSSPGTSPSKFCRPPGRSLDPGAVTLEDVPEGAAAAGTSAAERQLPDPHPSRAWTSGSGGRDRFARDLRTRGSRRHRPARHHLRGDPSDRARLLTGTLYAFVLVGGRRSCSILRRVRESLLAPGAARAGLHVDPRPHGTSSASSSTWPMSGGCRSSSGTAAEFGLNVMVRHMEGPRTAPGHPAPQHGARRAPQRARDHGGVRRPDGGPPPGHLQPGAAADPGRAGGLVAALAVLPALLTARSRPAELTATPTLSR